MKRSLFSFSFILLSLFIRNQAIIPASTSAVLSPTTSLATPTIDPPTSPIPITTTPVPPVTNPTPTGTAPTLLPTLSISPVSSVSATMEPTATPSATISPTESVDHAAPNPSTTITPSPQNTPTPTPTPTSKAILRKIVQPPLSFLFQGNPKAFYISDQVISPNGSKNLLFIVSTFLILGIFFFTIADHFMNKESSLFKIKNYFGFFFIILGIGIAIGILYINSPFSRQTRTFAPYTLLTSSWENYKARFINKDGRVIDYSVGDITTSEAQAYALLQAVWIDDKPTFDKVWTWTKENLQKRKKDHLFGWRWGKKPDGSYGFFADGGDNPASDADTDISLALILASRRWHDRKYEEQAKNVISDIWKLETDKIGKNRYLVAGTWAIGSDKDILNPSYFAPYAWRLFATVDTKNDWKSLINPAYDVLNQSGSNKLDKDRAVGLPPDWLAISKKPAGKIEPTQINGLTSNYGFDAIRIPWRIALDYQWNNSTQAKAYLKTLGFFSNYWQENKKVMAGYTHDGLPTKQIENPAMYATSLGYFLSEDKKNADNIFQNKIIKLYSNDVNSFRNDLPYYETNWLWFGSALYYKRLIAF